MAYFKDNSERSREEDKSVSFDAYVTITTQVRFLGSPKLFDDVSPTPLY